MNELVRKVTINRLEKIPQFTTARKAKSVSCSALEFKESILSGVCDYSVFYIERSTDADFALGTYLVGKV